MRNIFLTVISAVFFIPAIAQNKQLTYYDLEIGRYYQLRPNNLVGLQWQDNNTVAYFEGEDVKAINVETNKTDVFVQLDKINEMLQASGIDSLSRLSNISAICGKTILASVGENAVLVDVEQETADVVFKTPEEAENIEVFDDQKKAVFTLGQNLYLVKERGEHQKLTNDTVDGIVNGQVPHRNEFGIDAGAYWSSGGNKVAYYHKDESMVSKYPLVRIDGRVAELEEIRYPMAGMKSEEVTVCVYDLENKSTVSLKTGGDPEQYLTNLSWSPTGTELYMQQLNRKQNHMHLVKYDVASGNVLDTLFEEKHDKYVEPLNLLAFCKKQPENFYYQSARDGYNHIYLYNAPKKQLEQLTKGEWEVTEFIGLDENEENIFYISTQESPLERHLYKLNINSRETQRLTKEPGTHSVEFNDNYSMFIDKFSSTSVPNKIEVRDVNGKLIKTLLKAKNPMRGYKLGDVEIGTFKGGDSKTDLYYRVVKPNGFDPSKKYPVVFYVYGGPHAQLITNSWMGRTEIWHQYLAEHGYIGITIDTRGSAGRGMEFENVIHRQSGIPQMEDVLSAVDFFTQKGYIDTSRIGIHGWSYGGYMTTTMMTRHPEIFKVGVAGGPVIDWKYYEIMYGERYMDTPQENPEGYKLTNLNNYAKDLTGKLKIIHGSVDPTVVWQNSMSFVQSCIKAGTFPDYFMYPLHEHNVRGYDRIHLVELITEYFIENL